MRKYMNSDINANKLGIGPDTVYDMMILNICDENGSIPENRDIFIDKSIFTHKYENKYDMLYNIRGTGIIEIMNNCIENIEIASRITNVTSNTALHHGDIKILSKNNSSKSVTLHCKFNTSSCESEFNFLIISIIENGYYHPISTLHFHPEKINSLKSNFIIDYIFEFDNQD
ncbi:MAG: hypothetical protein M0P49_03405 [Bacilli bacterium]|nr:hypothetical protein [Bacilli bacterium]